MNNNYKKTFICKDINETNKLAIAFANIASKGDVFSLYGTLGVGKSAFSRGFIQHLTSSSEEVPSPTFTLVQSYKTKSFEIFHYDFYRLENPIDAYELGIEESFFYGVNLIEWPDKIKTLLPKNIWKINITINQNYRVFEVEVFNEINIKRLMDIKYE